MRKNLTQKTILIFAVLIVFVFGIFGIPKGVSGTALKDALLKRINLGLDLKGGTHLILQVMVDEAVSFTTTNDAAHIQTELQQNGITVGSVIPDTAHPETILISGAPADRAGDIRSVLNQRYGNQYDISSGANNTFTLTMKPSAVADLKKNTMEHSIEVIRQRVDSLGVSEPVIQEYNLGSDQILVELPGVDDPGRVKDVIQSTARLEIHEVQGGPWPDDQAALQALGGTVPYDSLLLHTAPGASAQGSGNQVYQIKRAAEVAGTDIRDAQASRNQNTNEPEVVFYLTTAAGNHFAEFTGANKGKSLCIVLDNKIQEVATIHDQIRDQGTISGGGIQEQQAKDLSMLLRTGALPASIHYLQESTVGPSLGADSIRQGVLASIVGMLAVMIFMLIYYRGAGINADLALFLNLVILLGFMGFTGSVLTLPGIAGVILTIGMGVDSNVLIFERIREELRAGKSPAAAVDQGFGHAWTTIIDTHVTTIVSAAILFIFGTGPVRGFAVTLTFGLLANLFTAVFVSRVIFDSHLNKKQRGEALSI
ncbi:protein translocase subunit SecD [Alloacidobacterium dinghuense]|uniref:Protein translocase subunit SecD n=1 Tax=Alloacidobacterium dinghuense TaxID=2763107 RepID=A0A7G8BG24_9BACT|nr:protein translocase subunit SecD [Alloacidobacterium dinghuense]QNI31494.1 protein translocase subunit SecD [Alloacidobacterium dinghuense]